MTTVPKNRRQFLKALLKKNDFPILPEILLTFFPVTENNPKFFVPTIVGKELFIIPYCCLLILMKTNPNISMRNVLDGTDGKIRTTMVCSSGDHVLVW